jgi:hypothetical protein
MVVAEAAKDMVKRTAAVAIDVRTKCMSFSQE